MIPSETDIVDDVSVTEWKTSELCTSSLPLSMSIHIRLQSADAYCRIYLPTACRMAEGRALLAQAYSVSQFDTPFLSTFVHLRSSGALSHCHLCSFSLIRRAMILVRT